MCPSLLHYQYNVSPMSKAVIKKKHYSRNQISYRINANINMGVREDILRPIIDTLQEMLLRYCRVHILRFDLHVPEFMPDNKIMSTFQRMLFKRIRRHYDIKPIGFIWVREQEKAKSQHYHCAIYLDGNKIRHPGLVQDWIAMIWEHLDGSSRHWSGYHNLRRADAEAIDEAVFHLSYLAKTRGKGFRPPQTKDYGWTRSICASKRPLSNAKGEE